MNNPKKVDGRSTWRFHKLQDTCTTVRGHKLKRCPFCDSKAILQRKRYKGHVHYSVGCTAQGICAFRPRAYSVWDERFKRAKNVVAIWNKRA